VADHRPARLTALGDALHAAHLDALLVTSLANVRYLTGFSGSNALVVVTARDTLLVTDFRYQTQAEAEVGDLARTVVEPQNLWAALWRLLAQMPGVEIVGFESAHLVHRDFERLLDGGARWQWRPTVDLVEVLRASKDADELALLQQAADVAAAALEATLPRVRPGLMELQIAGLLEGALRERGSEGFPFPSIVASGERSALPHARSSGRRVARGDFVLFDFGAIVGGYCSDVTRTVVLGPADDRQREVYGVVREANARASGAVRAGMRGRDADAVARRYIEERGFGDAFGHGLGHGIGLEVHEAPRLSKAAEGELPGGAVVTIEPGIYLPGWGGVRIEDDVYLAAAGPRILTSFPRELMELA
jgi:Xaa-Pro aminopeptidase